MSKTPRFAAGIFADVSVDGPAIGTLVAVVDRAKNLPNRKTMGKQNPYCAARLGKEARKTDTDLRGGQTPRWDQELRFTVHESPDYFKLKVSVFNDDKKTDLIGETWVDLKDLIIPGGSQNDHWHPLQYRGKYAGEVRIEMTYYDTRPEDEAVVERRSLAAEKIQAKASGSTASLSGPRHSKNIKRRPLPGDPNNQALARPPPPEKNPSAPAQLSSTGMDHARRPSKHSLVSSEAFYDQAPPGPRPMRGYDSPDDLQREWAPVVKPLVPIQQPAPVHPPASYPQVPPRCQPEQQYPLREPFREPPVEQHEVQPRSQYGRPHSSYETVPPVDYRASRHQEHLPTEPADMRPRSSHVYDTCSRQNSTQDYPFSSSESYVYNDNAVSYGSGPISSYPQHSSRLMIEQPPVDYTAPLPERHHYRDNSASAASSHSSLRPVSRESEYAAMQPSVEDEEEEGPPPPPPVHRSGVGQPSQQLVPSPRSSYRAYSLEYASSPRASEDVNFSSQPTYVPDNVRLSDLPPHTNGSSMPPSLVAGFDPMIADEETDRMYHEKKENRRRSTLFEEDGMSTQPPPTSRAPEPAPSKPPYPVDPPKPAEDRTPATSLVRSRGSPSSDSRIIPRRKSVSPQPPPVEERPSSRGIPFSPDSYDALNPNASRSALTSEPARQYDTSGRNELEASRDPCPIIGEDGREIDPSDHLPTDTWAPEPEKKNRKPELVVRFKNPPVQINPVSNSSRESRPIRVSFKPQTDGVSDQSCGRPTSSYAQRGSAGALEKTPPLIEASRGREVFRHYGGGRTYNRSPAIESLYSSCRPSVSPSPASRSTSSLYAPENPGPPLPAKIPIAQPMNQSYPMITSTSYNGAGSNGADRGGMEALSRELNTIDIGPCDQNRTLRKYVPRTMTTGYAI